MKRVLRYQRYLKGAMEHQKLQRMSMIFCVIIYASTYIYIYIFIYIYNIYIYIHVYIYIYIYIYVYM